MSWKDIYNYTLQIEEVVKKYNQAIHFGEDLEPLAWLNELADVIEKSERDPKLMPAEKERIFNTADESSKALEIKLKTTPINTADMVSADDWDKMFEQETMPQTVTASQLNAPPPPKQNIVPLPSEQQELLTKLSGRNATSAGAAVELKELTGKEIESVNVLVQKKSLKITPDLKVFIIDEAPKEEVQPAQAAANLPIYQMPVEKSNPILEAIRRKNQQKMEAKK